MAYSKFLGKYPQIEYDINKNLYGRTETVTDIFFRVGFLKEILANVYSYYSYDIMDGDTPETLAHDIYGDAGAHWMIIYANKIFDPQYDWPLDGNQFDRYIIEKYRDKVSGSSLRRLIIKDAGLGYSNGFISFEGGSGVDANATVVVDSVGRIKSLVINNAGSGYDQYDVVTANVAPLINANAVFSTANISVVINPTKDDLIYNYTKNTVHHYEKIITRYNTYTKESQTINLVVDHDMLTNGHIILANTSGEFEIGEIASVVNNNVAIFTGEVLSWNNSNNLLILANTTGVFEYAVTITGETSEANGVIVATSHPGYDFYNILPDNESVKNIQLDYYIITETTTRQAVSIWDYEYEKNESKRNIKIINPRYYPQIKSEFDLLLYKYQNTRSTLTTSQVRRII